jgi:hypothetical protein
MLEVPEADIELPLPVMLWALAANDGQGFRLQQSPDRVITSTPTGMCPTD